MHVLVGNLVPQLFVEVADFSSEKHEMQKHIGMHDEENGWPEREEAKERQVHIEERQSDRALQKKIAVGHASNGDEKIEQDKEIAEPKARADHGRVHDRVAQRPLAKTSAA